MLGVKEIHTPCECSLHQGAEEALITGRLLEALSAIHRNIKRLLVKLRPEEEEEEEEESSSRSSSHRRMDS